MPSTDLVTLGVLEAILFLLALVAITRDAVNCFRRRSAAAKVEVVRGEESMRTISGAYGAITTGMCVVAIVVATGIEGNKVLVVVFDYVVLTYLFFVSNWFRSCILRLHNWAKTEKG